MKILHTSDWHLGQILHGKDRIKDHQSMIRQMITIIQEHQPDVFILAGDIYDTAQPTTATQRFYAQAMVDIHNARPEMTIICVSGNHDSGQRFEVFQTPWEALRVYTVGTISNAMPDDNIVEVRDAQTGETKGYVAAVPYVNSYFVNKDFYDKLDEAIRARNTAGLPTVMINHLAVAADKCDYTGHAYTYDKYIGGIECSGIDELGRDYDYIALGHIHKAQDISTRPLTRYSGSPIPVGFDETSSGYEHSVTIVDIAAHGGEVTSLSIPILPEIPLVSIPQEGHAPWADVIAQLKAFDPAQEAYIRLNILLVDTESLPADIEAQISNALNGKQAKVIEQNTTRRMTSSEGEGGKGGGSMTVSDFKKLREIEMAEKILSDMKIPMTDELRSMFEEAHQRVLHHDANDEATPDSANTPSDNE